MKSGFKGHQIIFLCLMAFAISGCSSEPPLEDYSIARIALESARDKDAVRYAPSYFHLAEEAYRKGEHAFQEEDYKEAKEFFQEAKFQSERAENSSRLQKHKSGEADP